MAQQRAEALMTGHEWLKYRMFSLHTSEEVLYRDSHGLWLLDAGGMPGVRNRDQPRASDGLVDALQRRWHSRHILVSCQNQCGKGNAV